MATMIPDSFSPDVKSDAEKKIFNWFKSAPGTDNWVVLHSLGIASHQRVIHGEVDFLVLAPNLGMFALEVKGGRVQYEQGLWKFLNRYNESNVKVRGPFDQAWQGIYSIKASIKRRLDSEHEYLNHMIFGIGVMFPDIEYEAVGVDQEKWQVFDINDGKNVKKFIERLSDGAVRTFQRIGVPVTEDKFPTTDDVNYLLGFLRGDFDRDVPLKIKQRYSEEKLLKLTNEQSLCLEQLKDNLRVLVCGTAGTGKTLLAIEAVRKAASEGESVALFCFNHNLGDWLEACFSESPSDMRPAFVGTFHKYMIQQLRGNNFPVDGMSEAGMKNDYYWNVLPDDFLRNLSGEIRKFDRIVIDEAQDLITDKFLDVMDQSLQNGLQHGKWMMFGDFSMQSIYLDQMTEDRYFNKLSERSSYAFFRLTRNCRNTKKICDELENIVGVPEISAFEDSIDTPYVDHQTYSGVEDQKSRLVSVINDLLNKKISPDDIIILSPRKRSNSVVYELKNFGISDYTVQGKGHIRFSTVQAFKGLESPVIILVDIESFQDEKMLYVGLSRATFDLHILETEKAAHELPLLFKRRLENEG